MLLLVFLGLAVVTSADTPGQCLLQEKSKLSSLDSEAASLGSDGSDPYGGYYGYGGYGGGSYGGSYGGYYGSSPTPRPTPRPTSPPQSSSSGSSSASMDDFDYLPPGLSRNSGTNCKTGSLATVLQSDCNDINTNAQNTANSLMNKGNADLRPSNVAAEIVKRMQGEANKMYFKDPNLDRDMTMAGGAFDMIAAGHASFVGGEKMKNFMEANNFKNKDDLFSGMKSWANGRQTKKLVQALGSGALDLLGNIAGPLGVGFSLVGAVFNFWETDDLPTILNNLAEKILKACEEMIDAAIYREQMRVANDYLAAFSSEGKYVMDSIKALSEKPPPNAGTMEFVLLQSMETALATSRYQWMPFLNKRACEYEHKRCGNACANLRSALTNTVPLLAATHLALIQQMARSVATNPPLAKLVRDKFWRHVHEYYQYSSRWVVHTHGGWTPYSPLPKNPIYICGKGSSSNVKKEHDELAGFTKALYDMILADWSNQWKAFESPSGIPVYSWAQTNVTRHVRRSSGKARLTPLPGGVHVDFHSICGQGLECLVGPDATHDQAAAFRSIARKMMNSLDTWHEESLAETTGHDELEGLVLFSKQELSSRCCEENKAACLGCQVGLSAEEFCQKYGMAADCPSSPKNCMCTEFYKPVCAQYEGSGRIFTNECIARCYVGTANVTTVNDEDESVEHQC